MAILALLGVIFCLSSVFTAFGVTTGANLLAYTTTEATKKVDLKLRGGASKMSRLGGVFSEDQHKARLITYLTAGYPHPEETVDLLLAMQEGGADVIELGVPFTDPQADGATIQHANQEALKHGVSLRDCFRMVKDARGRGLTTPVVLMGYFNPFMALGLDTLMEMSVGSGVDGFIVVDLPPEEGAALITAASQAGLAYIPLVSPTTTDERIQYLSDNADSFLYCVSVTGVTGARGALPKDLNAFLARVEKNSNAPLAVGFGVSTRDHVRECSTSADGVVVGSAIINTIDQHLDQSPEVRASRLRDFVASLGSGLVTKPSKKRSSKRKAASTAKRDVTSRNFGEYGGRFIPETLVDAHRELEMAYEAARSDPTFQDDIDFYRREFIGGPTPLYFAENLTKKIGGANIWFKREELAHTGAHKINNAVGQALLCKRLGKKRIICETGAGQHGVATAAVCAHFGLDCTVYMGAVDCERQKLNVFRMSVLGAKCVPVQSGSSTLKDAINEAMRDWVTNVRDTHYLIGSAIGPHPFPTIVRDLQAVIGQEARAQILEKNNGKLPDAVVACVGGGSNAIGMFHAFRGDESVRLVGAEAGGQGLDAMNSATLTQGKPGVLHGTRTYLMQDGDGQIEETTSISAGLDYPGVGPEHAYLKDAGRAEYVAVTDEEALAAFFEVSRTEGIIPALEPSHALHTAMQLARELGPGKDVLVNLCGRGDKDMMTVAKVVGFDFS